MGINASEGNLSRVQHFKDGVTDNTAAMEVKPTTAPRIVSDITTTVGAEAQ